MSTTGTDGPPVTATLPSPLAEWHVTASPCSHAICILDPRGVILSFNAAFMALTGKQPGELTGRHCGDVMHGTSGFMNNCPTMRAQQSRQREKLEVELGGRWLEISVDPQRGYVTKILAATDRAAQLTRELLLFSRKHPSERKAIDLNDTIQRVELFLNRIIRENISCTTDLCDAPRPLFADSYQLEQVLLNLATNACDAMPDEGILAISTARVYLDESFIKVHGYGRVGWYACMTVEDNGRGMDEATRSRIFEPFFTTKEVGKGTGLGLAVVYGIVKQHEGYITVASDPGVGTIFSLYLPLVDGKGAETAAPESRALPPVGGSETILLAEDDEMVRALTAGVLTEYGYRVITAVDGRDAVQRLAANPDAVDLVILDLIMPNGNGKDALNEIRKVRPALHAIFVSGYAADTVLQETLRYEDVPLLSKPVMSAVLLQAVRSKLDGTARDRDQHPSLPPA